MVFRIKYIVHNFRWAVVCCHSHSHSCHTESPSQARSSPRSGITFTISVSLPDEPTTYAIRSQASHGFTLRLTSRTRHRHGNGASARVLYPMLRLYSSSRHDARSTRRQPGRAASLSIRERIAGSWRSQMPFSGHSFCSHGHRQGALANEPVLEEHRAGSDALLHLAANRIGLLESADILSGRGGGGGGA